MRNIIVVNFEQGRTEASAYDKVWQYNYGQILRIQGLKLPRNVEIHFATQRTGGIALPRVGVTRDGVTDVVIPDSMLENGDATSDYPVYAFVYLTDETSGQTEYMIRMQIKSRPRPEVPGGSEDPGAFHEAVQEVRKLTEKATESERQAEGWAHGREDLPERAQDNAKYYAGKASEDAKKTAADRTAVESVVQDVTQMQGDVARDLEQVQKLTGQAQTSATNAALSEQAAKTSETNAQTAQTAAETAEANAELAERNAKTSEQAVEKAKQLVTQMGQEVLNNKNHVDQTVQAFDLTAQQALADVNNAGQTQTERVQNAGNTAVESVKTAQGTATQAVETAKTEAVQAIQTEGAAQTGNVTQEGEKQVQAVQQAAQEIVADREQIQQNKAGIEALKQGKADAIVETASGETIQVKDSSGLGFEGLRIFGKSTQDGVPTPESPVPIVNVGDKGTIEVGVTGTNLFDVSKIEDTWNGSYGIKNNNGVLTMVAPPNDSSISSNKTLKELCPQLKVGETYILDAINSGKAHRIYLASVKKMWEYRTSMVMTDEMLNSVVRFYISANANDSGIIHNIQVNKGDTVLPYEPYQEPQTLTISTPNGLPGIKVDSDGNYTDENGQQWVCDEIDLERGKYVQRIAKYIFDGTEAGEDKYLPTIVVAMNTDGITGIHPGKIESNYGTINYSNSSGRSFGFKTMNWGVNGINELRQFMKNKYDSGDPVIAQYIAKEPIEHDLTPEEIAAYKALYTNYPTTVISNDESAHMEVSYVADTKNYIAKVNEPLQKQITDLQNALISQKISGGGIKVSDSARVPVIKFSMWGKTEQVQTSGTNLFDVSKIDDAWNGSYGIKNNNGVLTVASNSSSSAVNTNKLLKELCPQLKNNETCVFNAVNSGKSNMIYLDNAKKIWFYHQPMVMTEEMLNSIVYLYISDKINDSGTIRNIQVNRGETVLPYEPYSGGFSSPSPEYPQPIEVTDQPVTVTIKGGTEQQSITLMPPKPLTKWDKLEKIDGVWQWRYQSECLKFENSDGWVFYPNSYNKAKFQLQKKSEINYEDKFLQKDLLCSHFAENINAYYNSGNTCSFTISSIETNSLYFKFGQESNVSNMETFKKWIGENKPVVIYKAATPEYIPLSQSEQNALNSLAMYAPTTEITNDGGCTMELTYTVDTKSYVDTKIAEISKAIL